MARCSILTLVALLACAAVGCHAQKWTAMADAANQIPALTEEEVGGAMATFKMWATEEGMLEYSLEVSDITNLTMAHIHIGNSTESGAVAVQLVPEDTSTPMLATPVSGAFSIASAMIDTASLGGMTLSEFLDAADTEGLYVNLHTEKYPTGAIRGQVMPVPDLEFMADLSGENQPEPLTDVGSGTFMMTAGEDGTYTWELEVKDVTNLTMAHIHIGNASASGPVAVALLPTDGEAMFDPPQTGSKTYTGNFTSADIMELTPEEFRADLRINTEMNFYVNLHSTEYPAGVIRGQLMWMNDMAMAPAEAPMAADEAMEAPAGAPGSSATTASFNAAVMLAAALLAAVML